jgi:hypothetical protein
MTQDLKQSYRGVLCTDCKEAIPVPTIVVNLEAESGDAEHSVRVFNLRCRACEKEQLYRTTEIIELDGTPRVRTRARPSPAATSRRLGRAAHA